MTASHQDFLVEIGTEELPPKALRSLQNAFSAAICAELDRLNIPFGKSEAELAAPRRLAALISDVAEKQPDQRAEMLGPAVSAAFDDEGQPTGAALGFARKAGVEVSELQQIDSPKGPRLAHSSTIVGKPVTELLPEIVSKALAELPLPKRMRWGSSRVEFVRPVHWVLMLLGDQTIEADVLGIASSNTTRGHRFHANKEIPITHAGEYSAQLLSEGKVQVNYLERMESIRASVTELAEKQLNGTAVIGDDLLEEVCALVEWPVPLAGKFEERFLDVPAEALISSMKEHQKYFHVVDANGKLMPHFITLSNIESTDPEKVIDGNERVIRPRLADAAFFYETDKKVTFDSFRERLKPIVFQAKLGSVFDKTERVARLAADIAPLVGANSSDADRAGQLSKCDLVSDMVMEFDDLQGIMGRYYAEASGENAEVVAAMFEQYLPRYAGDKLPKTQTGTALALADRLDTLTGIFGIGQTPSGSKDPFALRRASLGVLRILVESGHQVSLSELIDKALSLHQGTTEPAEATQTTLLDYMLDRFAAWFADLGVATEVFLSVRALQNISGLDNPADIYARVLAVNEFAQSANAEALAAANKRVANILAKSSIAEKAQVDPELFQEEAETALFSAMNQARDKLDPLLSESNYQGALSVLSGLREDVDTFFDQVMVMAEETAVRNNRLALLYSLRSLFLSIADISVLPAGD